MSSDDRAAALREALVDRFSDPTGEGPSAEELFAYAEGRLNDEDHQRLRERLVRHPEDRKRLEEIREFALAEAQLAPPADRQAEDAVVVEESAEVDEGWNDLLDRLGEPGVDRVEGAEGDGVEGVTIEDPEVMEPDLPNSAAVPIAPKPWLRVAIPTLAALSLVVAVLIVGPGDDPGVGWDPAVAASQATVVFEQRSGPVQHVEVVEGERLRLEVFHPALPTDCAEVELRVLRPDGDPLVVTQPEQAERWLRIEVSGVEAGRHAIELTGCGVDAVTEIEVLRPEDR